MRRPVLAVLLAAVLTVPAGAVWADGGPADGGPAAQACYDDVPGATTVNSPERIPCRLAQQADRQAGAVCRAAVTDGSCQAVDGRAISPAAIAAYQRSWVHRALTLQRQLGERAPIIDTQIVHTHNSFNASAYGPGGRTAPVSYYPTLTNQDPNQVYSLTDQLAMDVRFVELDLHWVPSPYGTPATNGYWVTLCHGDGQQAPATGTWVHVGCTADRPAQDGFAELHDWLVAHPSEFLFVYLENQLYDASPVASQQLAHDTAASLMQQYLGSLVYRPTGYSAGHCVDAPWSSSVASLRAHGARVILVGNCGPGSAWPSWVFTRGPKWNESGDPTTYSATDCAHDSAARATGSSFRRFFEDSTVLATARQSTAQITAQTTAAMVRCGVNIIGMDQLTTDDPRLAALVWSWAPGQPSTGGCAEQLIGSGRFASAGCGTPLPYACRTPHSGWVVTAESGPWNRGADACAVEYPGSVFGVPNNGYDDAQLAGVWAGRGTLVVGGHLPSGTWVSYADTGGQWRNFEGLLAPHPKPPVRDHGRGHGKGHGHAVLQ